MTFPCIELKFSSILRTPTRTIVEVRLYRVDDGGLDDQGQQIYVRTLKRQRVLNLDAGWDDARLRVTGRAKVLEYALEEGFNLTDDRLICNL